MANARRMARQIGWMLLIWILSVAALGIAAYAMRLLMRAIGMGT